MAAYKLVDFSIHSIHHIHMSRNWKKYGSPYDPAHSGKNRVTGNRAEHTATERRYDVSRDYFGDYDPYRSDFLRRAMEDIARRGEIEFIAHPRFEVIKEDGRQGHRGPPPSYTAARNEVKQWILGDVEDQSFDDIVGVEESLGQLREAIEGPVKHKKIYEEYGLTMPKGALLYGPPGCGKTMFAKAAASEMKKLYGGKCELIAVAGADLQSMWVGQTEKYIRQIFAYAREYEAYHKRPLVIFIDEAETILPDRAGRYRRVHSYEESQVATFLSEMDGMKHSGAFVMLASNRPEAIDQAVLRDGRCDFKIVVKKPTIEAVEIILRKNFEGIKLSKGVKVEDLVFAAVECLQDPAKILVEASSIMVRLDIKHQEVKSSIQNKHFLLEHIISGAMAAGIPNRAKRHAFHRDVKSGKISGVVVMDVVNAVNDVFQENLPLEHSFAFNEFMEEFSKEASEAHQKKLEKD